MKVMLETQHWIFKGLFILQMGKIITKEIFIERSKIIHGDRYDYSKVIYTKAKVKVLIICKIHGEFFQTPDTHVHGKGCRKCANEKLRKERATSNLDFLKRVESIHGIYKYPNLNILNQYTKIEIECNKHGIFKQTPDKHLRGKGCPKCSHNISTYETEIQEIIINLGLKVENGNRNIIKPYELDIFIPELNKAIEFNGSYWHYSDKYFKSGKHANKSKACKEKGIRLLYIREDLWLKDKNRMKNVIINFLNLADLAILKLTKNKIYVKKQSKNFV